MEAHPCGDVYAENSDEAERLRQQERTRYELEPYIASFARFSEGAGRDVLEIGVGMGADHAQWARAKPRSLHGVDLTKAAVELTEKRLRAEGLGSDVRVADAEKLPFQDASFDLVYSWGVLHHSPNTPQAIREVCRVLRPGGVARILVYHRWSLVGAMLWTKYALLAWQPWTSLTEIYARHLESPGTKAYTVSEARRLFAGFSAIKAETLLSFGDLLEGRAGERHGGPLLGVARRLYPRALVRVVLKHFGLYLLVEATR